MQTLNIPSERKEFTAAASFFDTEVRPYLQSNETRRRDAVVQSIAICVLAGALAAAAFAYSPGGEIGVRVGIIVGFLGFGAASGRLALTQRKLSDGLLRMVCDHLGLRYRNKLGAPDYIGAFERLKLLPNFNRSEWEDEVQGEREGLNFTLCEAHLKYRSGGRNKNTRTVFHGQLLVLDYHKRFLGETVIKRDAGILNSFMKPGARFQRVGLGSSQFEKAFEAWSTDQVEARELLDPIVLERFQELDRLFDGAKLRAAFSEGRLYIALEVGDKLNMGSMFSKLATPERFETILKEFDLIFDLIDVAVKRANGKIDGAFSVSAVR